MFYSAVIIGIDYLLLQIKCDSYYPYCGSIYGYAMLSIIRTGIAMAMYHQKQKYPNPYLGIARCLNLDIIFSIFYTLWQLLLEKLDKISSPIRKQSKSNLESKSPMLTLRIKIPSPLVLVQLLQSLLDELSSRKKK